MELHIDIKLAGDDFPSADEQTRFDELVAQLDGSDYGPVLDSGAGRGHADIFLRVSAAKQRIKIEGVRAVLAATRFSDRFIFRILHDKRGGAEPVRLPRPGEVFIFPVFGSKFGACRVVRLPTQKEELFFGETKILVATSSWIGDAVPALDEPALREVLILTHHSHKGRKDYFWTLDPLPESYLKIGGIEPSPDELKEECRYHGGWACAVGVEAQVTWDKERGLTKSSQSTTGLRPIVSD